MTKKKNPKHLFSQELKTLLVILTCIGLGITLFHQRQYALKIQELLGHVFSCLTAPKVEA